MASKKQAAASQQPDELTRIGICLAQTLGEVLNAQAGELEPSAQEAIVSKVLDIHGETLLSVMSACLGATLFTLSLENGGEDQEVMVEAAPAKPKKAAPKASKAAPKAAKPAPKAAKAPAKKAPAKAKRR